MSVRNLTAIAIATTTISVLTACQTIQSTPPAYAGCVAWEQQSHLPALAGVSMLSPELAKFIGVRGISVSRTTSGLVSVQTSVYNCSDVDVVLNFRTHFTDSRRQTEPPSAWKTLILAARGRQTYFESAVSPASAKVAVEIQDGNRGQSQFAPGQTYTAPPAMVPQQ